MTLVDFLEKHFIDLYILVGLLVLGYLFKK